MKYRLLMAYQDCISTFGPLLEDVLIEVKDLIGVGYDNLRARFQYVYYKFQKSMKITSLYVKQHKSPPPVINLFHLEHVHCGRLHVHA